MSKRGRPDDRKRDAERTRAALLDAAMEAFAAHGKAGARVSDIAERAGVNKQLISYYFGGKDGLYDAILERWYAQEAQLNEDCISLGELAWRYLEVGLRQPALQRLFIRESLDEDLADVAHDPDAPELVDLRARQAAGEIADDLDPAFVLLALQGMVVAHLVFASDVRRFTGLDPSSPEYLAAAGDQLRRIVHHLAAD